MDENTMNARACAELDDWAELRVLVCANLSAWADGLRHGLFDTSMAQDEARTLLAGLYPTWEEYKNREVATYLVDYWAKSIRQPRIDGLAKIRPSLAKLFKECEYSEDLFDDGEFWEAARKAKYAVQICNRDSGGAEVDNWALCRTRPQLMALVSSMVFDEGSISGIFATRAASSDVDGLWPNQDPDEFIPFKVEVSAHSPCPMQGHEPLICPKCGRNVVVRCCGPFEVHVSNKGLEDVIYYEPEGSQQANPCKCGARFQVVHHEFGPEGTYDDEAGPDDFWNIEEIKEQ